MPRYVPVGGSWSGTSEPAAPADGIRITLGDLHLSPTSAMCLRTGDLIAFDDDIARVVGVEYLSDYFTLPSQRPTSDRGNDAVALVTESPDGSQFVDYVNPVRIFTVIRLTDAVAE